MGDRRCEATNQDHLVNVQHPRPGKTSYFTSKVSSDHENMSRDKAIIPFQNPLAEMDRVGVQYSINSLYMPNHIIILYFAREGFFVKSSSIGE